MVFSEKEKEDIINLWRNPSFHGSFSGLTNFQSALKYDKNIVVSRNELLTIMQEVPEFIIESKRIRKFPRRKVIVHGYAKTFQADLAEMYEFNTYKWILVVIDLFSRRISVSLKQTSSSIRCVNNLAKQVRFSFAQYPCSRPISLIPLIPFIAN